MPHISIKAQELFTYFGLHVTNSLFTSWIVVLILAVVALAYRRVQFVTNLVDMLLRGLYGLFRPIFHDKIHVFFPLVATFFIYIFALNWFGLLPGVGSVGFTREVQQESHVEEVAQKKKVKTDVKDAQVEEVAIEDSHDKESKKETASATTEKVKEHEQKSEEHHEEFVPFLRGGTADLNATLALSVLAVILIQYYGFAFLGWGYLKKFINLANPINAFVGFLEIISEISKIISLAFRLFGNVFAGEVLLTVVSFLVPVLASLPFLMFEFFVGFMQALVFSMLTSIFLSVAVTSHDSSHH